MMPNASVAGLYIAHPDARYFHIGHIDETQREHYAHQEASPPKRPANGYRYNNRGVLLNSLPAVSRKTLRVVVNAI